MLQQLCKVNDLSSGELREFKVNNRRIVVARTNDGFYAIHGVCPHQGVGLAAGSLTGTNLPSSVGVFCYGRKDQVIRCPWHNHEYDITTGKSIHDPEKNKLKSYKLVVDGDNVMIDL